MSFSTDGRYGSALRRAAVAEFEVRLRVPDTSGAWRLVVSLPTGIVSVIPKRPTVITTTPQQCLEWACISAYSQPAAHMSPLSKFLINNDPRAECQG